MPRFIIWHKGGRRRAGRSEDKLLGTIEAADEREARRIADERWPGVSLLVDRHRGDVRPSAPPRQCE
jgi:hypothetical protein